MIIHVFQYAQLIYDSSEVQKCLEKVVKLDFSPKIGFLGQKLRFFLIFLIKKSNLATFFGHFWTSKLF